MRLILASNNKNKLREFRQLVEGMDDLIPFDAKNYVEALFK